MKLKAMLAACAEARAAVIHDADRDPDLRDLRWRVSRGANLLGIDKDGQRLGDDGWHDWNRRKSDIDQMRARYPEAVKIIVDSGVNFAANRQDYEDGIYELLFWQATVWSVTDEIDGLVRKRTGFSDLADILAAKETYRPSCDMRDLDMVRIADAYDALAQATGDPRRAYRYGAKAA